MKLAKKKEPHFAYGSILEALSHGLYPDRKHILREFVQNAYDALADLKRNHKKETLHPIEISSSPASLIIADKGVGMSKEEIERYRYLGYSQKKPTTHAGFRGIGKFSAISACDRLIVRSSKLGNAKAYQVEIDAAGIWARLKKEKNTPLEPLLREHSHVSEGDEQADVHYTVVELHGIHKDAQQLVDDNIITAYLIQTAPIPFDPAFSFGTEISERLHQIDPRFLEIPVLVNGKAIYKPALNDTSHPGFRIISAKEGSVEKPLAYVWFCEHLKKGQFPNDEIESGKGRKHPRSGLHFRTSNIAIGDSMLVRKAVWHSSPERAFYFVGEIHVLDAGVVPTSDRGDFEDNESRSRLYERCNDLVTELNFQADLNSQRHRFREVVDKGETLVSQTEQELNAHKLENELREDKDFQVQKVLEDLEKRLSKSRRAKKKDKDVIRRASRLVRRAQHLHHVLKAGGNGHSLFVDIGHDLAMDEKTKIVYSTIISVLREEFRREADRFEKVVHKINEALRRNITC
jgi:molecular chaperone HtpG